MQIEYVKGALKDPIPPVLNFSKDQISHRDLIQNNINSGYLKFTISRCFCGSKFSGDKLIEEYDAWGFNIPTVVCGSCHTIRSKYFFDFVYNALNFQ